MKGTLARSLIGIADWLINSEAYTSRFAFVKGTMHRKYRGNQAVSFSWTPD
jgi:hypothetical protein